MNPCRTIVAAASVCLFATVPSVLAYVGPGAGLTFVGSFIGLCLALLVALWAVISWPVRRLLRRRRKAQREADGEDKTGARQTDDRPSP